jgi:hypothetical protein
MDGQRNLEREIETLLSVEPSPEFLARVRTRVAEEPVQVGWRVSWMVAAGGAVAVVVAIVLWQSREPASSITASEQRTQVAAVEERTASPEVAPPVRRDTTPRVARLAPAPRANETTSATGLVPVVAEEDGRAFDALLATIRDPDVVLVFEHEASASALSTSAIAIPPITIEPLPTTLEGGVE